MKIINMLHFYQPHNQQDDILNRIVNESYRPVLSGLLDHNNAKVVINITGSLVQMLRDKGYDDIVSTMKKLYERGQIELTGSAYHHAFLPLLEEREAERQITLNEEVIGDLTCKEFSRGGFFSPEMAINDRVIRAVSKMGYSWIAAPEVANSSEYKKSDVIFKDDKTGIVTMFRNKRVSALILSGVVRDAETLIKETRDLHETDKYWFTVMDVETFGHHRIGHEKFLVDIYQNDFFECITVGDLMRENLQEKTVKIRPSTWTNEEQDFWLDKEKTKATTAKSFILWKDPENPIHKLQWKLLDLVIDSVHEYGDKKDKKWIIARVKLDYAIASDQFWWASAKPWWSLEMLEQGAFSLKDVLVTLVPGSDKTKKAEELYRKILDQAFEWQRSGYIRKRHLEDSATFMKKPFKERAPAEWYNQIILEFEDEMKRVAERQEFEKAVKWRDALIKLKRGSDIYDILHVVNELWSARNIPEVKPFLEHDWDEFSDFAKGYFRDAKSREDFENLKERKEQTE